MGAGLIKKAKAYRKEKGPFFFKNKQGMIMKTLAELDKTMKELNEMKSELSDRIGGGKWIICFYDTYESMRFGVWKLKHNWDINGKVATLSTDAIIDPGAYTEEELQPVLERIMELANE